MKEQVRLTLKELNLRVQEVIRAGLPAPVWVVAEISDIKVNTTGHCYLELVEKSDTGEELVARARGTIWAYVFRMLRPYFETTTGQELRDGLKILVKASVEFHELYGYSLNISDIDPGYTLGDLALQKAATLRRLEEEGVIDMNRSLELAIVPQRIAIISSEQAAGFEDFLKQLQGNPYHYRFYTRLFPAIMQGKDAEESIVEAIEKIYRYEDFFDAVVLIRGGGARSDLSCYNGYRLAYHISQFPLPVLTGIGHERDESVADLVAHTRLKTPTAVAEFLIDRLAGFEEILNEQVSRCVLLSGRVISSSRSRLERTTRILTPMVMQSLESRKNEILRAAQVIKPVSLALLRNRSHRLSDLEAGIVHSIRLLLRKKTEQTSRHTWELNRLARQGLMKQGFRLDILEKTIRLTDPSQVLQRGFSITLHNNRVLRDPSKVERGDELETRIQLGTITSKVERTTLKGKGNKGRTNKNQP